MKLSFAVVKGKNESIAPRRDHDIDSLLLEELLIVFIFIFIYLFIYLFFGI